MANDKFIVPEKLDGENNEDYRKRIEEAAKEQGFAIIRRGGFQGGDELVKLDAGSDPAVKNIRTR